MTTTTTINAVTTVKLSQLRLSPLNVRKVEPTAIEAMADDIAAHGVIQNLAVYQEAGKYWVFIGGRRLRGLDLLRKRKTISASCPVNVTIRDKADAIELSVVENVQREDMHPADTARGYVLLRDECGLGAVDIAARMGHSVGHVEKLLRLGSLAPELLDAFGAGKMGMAAAQALTISDDHAAQIAAFERWGNNANSIRRALTVEKVDTSSGAFLFVGMDAYEAAGGTVTTDLFEQESYADCPDILDELIWSKLDAIRARFEAEGWHTVEVVEDAPTNIYSRPYISPVTREPTEEEAAALVALDKQIADLEQEGDSPELAGLLDRRATLDAALMSFTDEQKATGGVCAYIGYDGELQIRHWLAKVEKQESAEKVETGPYSASMIERLTGIRTLALQQSVAAQPDLALDILIDTLAARLVHNQQGYDSPADIFPTTARISVEDELFAGSGIVREQERLVELFGDIPADSRFPVIRAMEQGDKMRLLASMVAVTLNGVTFSHGGASKRQETADRYAEAAGLDLGAVWTPAQPFFDRLQKGSLLAILTSECGEAAAENCAKMKKDKLAVTVNERLPAGWLPEPARSFAPVVGQADEDEAAEVA